MNKCAQKKLAQAVDIQCDIVLYTEAEKTKDGRRWGGLDKNPFEFPKSKGSSEEMLYSTYSLTSGSIFSAS
jgi:hypothetical protein